MMVLSLSRDIFVLRVSPSRRSIGSAECSFARCWAWNDVSAITSVGIVPGECRGDEGGDNAPAALAASAGHWRIRQRCRLALSTFADGGLDAPMSAGGDPPRVAATGRLAQKMPSVASRLRTDR